MMSGSRGNSGHRDSSAPRAHASTPARASRSVVVHAHFYQPPREDPWREEVEPEPSAAPFTDWNARVLHECYEPFAAARVLDLEGHVRERLNLYAWTSFDVAPTLMRWLERHAGATYAAVLAADRESTARLGGHGNAVATTFHHVILPLASRADKVTEVRWGVADFRRRYGRDPEGFWLPETAADEETLEVLALEGLRFTIVAPHQVEHPPASGEAVRFDAGGGHAIAVFPYDAGVSAHAAFGPLLDDGFQLADRLTGGAARLVSAALDGETFGHHRKFAEMALAVAMRAVSARRGLVVENFASFLGRVPATAPAIVVCPSSWSCGHGVERWRGDCSCGITAGRSHAWRRPLRAALNWLARELDARYAAGAARAAAPGGDAAMATCATPDGDVAPRDAFANPAAERDAWGAVAALERSARYAYVLGRFGEQAAAHAAFDLLDGQRARLGMFGSCAWFFDEPDGHETALMLRLAAYAIDRLGDADVEREFVARLALAAGTPPQTGGLPPTAADAWRNAVAPMRERGWQ